ncbi:MAG: isoprenylcysteine carboxylmethyltransferase family protein [Chloroflexi bacterium]|nr:isoprenylcysteine carboxylmethyltransferase family protein [Chloroflexota bacterium]
MLIRLFNFALYFVVAALPIAAGGGIQILSEPRIQVFALVGLSWAVLESSLKPEQFARKSFDVGWVLLALFGVMSGISVSVWEYRNPIGGLPRADWLAALGFALCVLGLATRYAAIRTLGKFFSYELKVQGDHRIVQEGLYRYIRHPSYTGFGLILLGMPLILNSGLGLLAMIGLVGGGFAIRIAWEENVLIEHFGDAYREYQKKTKRLIPFVW